MKHDLSIALRIVIAAVCAGLLIVCAAHAQTVVTPPPVVVQPQPVVVQPAAPAVVAPAPVVVQPPQVYVQPAVVWVHEYRPGPFGILMWGHWKRQQPAPQQSQAPVPGPVTPQYQQQPYQQPYMPPPARGAQSNRQMPATLRAVETPRDFVSSGQPQTFQPFELQGQR